MLYPKEDKENKILLYAVSINPPYNDDIVHYNLLYTVFSSVSLKPR